MKTMSELISKLESVCLYEFQHMPVYFRDGEKSLDDGRVKYFWDIELAEMIESGQKIYGHNEDLVLMFASLCAIRQIVKDFDDKRPRTVIIFKEDCNKVRNNLSDLAYDHEERLYDMSSENERSKLCTGLEKVN